MKDLFGEEIKENKTEDIHTEVDKIKQRIAELTKNEWNELLSWMMKEAEWNGV